MDAIGALRLYVEQMVTRGVAGMKTLLLDKETTTIVSMVYSQTEILSKEVFLIDHLHNQDREPMQHMKAIVFVRPTEENIQLLCKELKAAGGANYGQYHIYFSNVINQRQIQRIAAADVHESVKGINEYYGDYIAVNSNLFSLDVTNCLDPLTKQWRPAALKRSTEGLFSLLLSMKQKPSIRFQRASSLAKRLAQELSHSIEGDSSLFEFRVKPHNPPVLLILDRRDDPVTPCLNQWTYQAMVHELLGINHSRVDLSHMKNSKLKEVVLSTSQDEFFRSNLFKNFGEIAERINQLIQTFQAKKKGHEDIKTIDDMKSFIENYPEFKQMSGTVDKHVSVVGELSRLIDAHELLEVSELEQDLATKSDHAQALASMTDLFENPRVRVTEKWRLLLLYALRYEDRYEEHVQKFKNSLARSGVMPEDFSIISSLLKYAGNDVRSGDLFSNKSLLAFSKQALKGLKGVNNIYTQHKPALYETLQALLKGKLKEQEFPFLGNSIRERPRDVIVFIAGGVTYEEALHCTELSKEANVRILLGGSTIHNFKSFCKEVKESVH